MGDGSFEDTGMIVVGKDIVAVVIVTPVAVGRDDDDDRRGDGRIIVATVSKSSFIRVQKIQQLRVLIEDDLKLWDK